jgi:hypothetical protein
MKKICITAALLGMLAGTALAQEEYSRGEIYAGWGYVTSLQIAEALDLGLFDAFTNDLMNRYDQDVSSWGGAYVGYNYFVTPRWSVGWLFNFSSFMVTNRYSSGYNDTITINTYSIMLRTDFRYGNWRYFQMYSGLAVGSCYLDGAYDDVKGTSRDDEFTVAYHVTVLGMRFGSRVGIFVELGFGFNGLLTAGASTQF